MAASKTSTVNLILSTRRTNVPLCKWSTVHSVFSFTLGLEETSGGWGGGWIYVLYQHKHTKKAHSSLGAKVRTRKVDHPNRRKVKKKVKDQIQKDWCKHGRRMNKSSWICWA